mgnify:CR=1 FL=1
MAGGGQNAVVKVRSYAAGGVRIGALVNYISREGTEAAETETGELLRTKAELSERIAHWLDAYSDQRKASKDIVSFELSVDRASFGGGEGRDAKIREALSVVLEGHRYAYRLRNDEDRTIISIVGWHRRDATRLSAGHCRPDRWGGYRPVHGR